MAEGLTRWGLKKYCSGCDFYDGKCTFYSAETLNVFTGADSCSKARIGGMEVILFEGFARTKEGDFARNSPELVEVIHQYKELKAREKATLEETEAQRLKAQRPEVGLGAWMIPRPVRGVPGCGIAQGLRDRIMARGMR